MKRYAVLLTAVFGVLNVYAQSPVKRVFPKLETPTVANLGPGCRLQLMMPKGVTLNVGYLKDEGAAGFGIDNLRYFLGDFDFGFRCYRADTPRVKSGWAIPKPGGGWQPNKNSSIAELIPSKAFHFYDLVAKNSQGWALTLDDTFGDERFRRRVLSYCLIYEAKAICGQDFMGYLPDIQRNKRADLTPHALEVLRSIEFLEDAPPPALGKP